MITFFLREDSLESDWRTVDSCCISIFWESTENLIQLTFNSYKLSYNDFSNYSIKKNCILLWQIKQPKPPVKTFCWAFKNVNLSNVNSPFFLPITGPHQSHVSSWKIAVSKMQNKDVAVCAASWHTHTRPQIRATLSHAVSSGAIRADKSLLSFWVCCSCCVVSGKPLWWLSFIFTSSNLLLLSFWYLCQIEKENFSKLVSEWG